MIKAPPGLKAVYKFTGARKLERRKVWCGDERIKLKDDEYLSTQGDIVAWDDDGDPMMIGERGRLVPAMKHANFVGVERDPLAVVHLIPVPVDLVLWRYADGEASVSPIVAMAMLANEKIAAVCGVGNDTELVTGDDAGYREYVEVHHRSEGLPSEAWIALMSKREELHTRISASEAETDSAEQGA